MSGCVVSIEWPLYLMNALPGPPCMTPHYSDISHSTWLNSHRGLKHLPHFIWRIGAILNLQAFKGIYIITNACQFWYIIRIPNTWKLEKSIPWNIHVRVSPAKNPTNPHNVNAQCPHLPHIRGVCERQRACVFLPCVGESVFCWARTIYTTYVVFCCG